MILLPGSHRIQNNSFFIIIALFTVVCASVYVILYDAGGGEFFTVQDGRQTFLYAMIVFWLAMCATDMAYTIKQGSRCIMQYEQSQVLRHVLHTVSSLAGIIKQQRQKSTARHNTSEDRMLLATAAAVTLAIEGCIVFFSPYVVWPHVWNFPLLCLIAAICGMVHISGFMQTRRFVSEKADHANQKI